MFNEAHHEKICTFGEQKTTLQPIGRP